MINNSDKISREYELAFMLKAEDPSVVIKALSDKGLSVTQENQLTKVRLAYPIKKERQAYFGVVDFSGDPEAIKDLNADLKLIPDVLRFLIITPPIAKKASSGFAPVFGKRPAKKPSAPSVLSNEALEKKIEEILQ